MNLIFIAIFLSFIIISVYSARPEASDLESEDGGEGGGKKRQKPNRMKGNQDKEDSSDSPKREKTKRDNSVDEDSAPTRREKPNKVKDESSSPPSVEAKTPPTESIKKTASEPVATVPSATTTTTTTITTTPAAVAANTPSSLTSPREDNDIYGASIYFNMVFPLVAMCILGVFVYNILAKQTPKPVDGNATTATTAYTKLPQSESKQSGSGTHEEWEEWGDEEQQQQAPVHPKEDRKISIPNSPQISIPSSLPLKDKPTPPKTLSDDLFASTGIAAAPKFVPPKPSSKSTAPVRASRISLEEGGDGVKWGDDDLDNLIDD